MGAEKCFFHELRGLGIGLGEVSFVPSAIATIYIMMRGWCSLLETRPKVPLAIEGTRPNQRPKTLIDKEILSCLQRQKLKFDNPSPRMMHTTIPMEMTYNGCYPLLPLHNVRTNKTQKDGIHNNVVCLQGLIPWRKCNLRLSLLDLDRRKDLMKIMQDKVKGLKKLRHYYQSPMCTKCPRPNNQRTHNLHIDQSKAKLQLID